MNTRLHSTGTPADGAPAMRTFRMQLAVAVVIYTVAVYALLYAQTQRLLNESLRAQGASYFDLVYHTRAWNAAYGGVWVLKRPGVETNPYLLEMGITADIVTSDGKQLTLRNPSLMTHEISERTVRASGVSFHLVSHDPVNPLNAPDDWEETSLERFENEGIGYADQFDRTASPPVYRYMEPLRVDQACLDCHAAQGYEVGDVRGAVTVSIPTVDVDRQLQRTGIILLLLTGVTVALSLSVSQWFVTRLGTRLEEANRRLTEMAVTDDLTGLPNRRSMMERLTEQFARSKRMRGAMSVVVLDIDHFKAVNDAHGHGVGDAVLREIARRMRETIREYDAIGRVGGEEFLIVAPDTDSAQAIALADRVLQSIRALPVTTDDLELRVTASAGVASLREGDVRADDLIARADDALYTAKAAGRDRTIAAT